MSHRHDPKTAKLHVRVIAPKASMVKRVGLYRTPPRATLALLAVERFRGCTYDPCCGDGAIAKVLKAHGLSVVATDLVSRGYGRGGVDFLKTKRAVRNVVMNPPFTHAQEFAQHALDTLPPTGKVAMIGRLAWLEGKKRRAFFTSTPLARVWVFSERINISRDGWKGRTDGRGGMVAFAWYVWDKSHKGPPILGWL